MHNSFRFSHVLRLFIIFLIAFFLVAFVPVFPIGKISVIVNPISGLLLFIFLSGFLINQSMTRNQALQLSILFELSHTRRIMHVVEQMGVNQKWKNTAKKSMIAYLHGIASQDFLQYRKSDTLFRLMTHQVYLFVPRSDKDKLLFGELLTLTREWAFQRQELVHDIDSPISAYTWSVFLLVGVIDLFLLFFVRDATFISTTYLFLLIVSLFLIVDLLIELSGLTQQQRNNFQKLYVENSERIKKE